MAGRSGAAALEIALREAANSFDPKVLGAKLRQSNSPDDTALANLLDGIASMTPVLERRDGEVVLSFCGASVEVARRVDISDLCCANGYGVELVVAAGNDQAEVVVRVSFYEE